MARGWESKDVEAQVAETEEPKQKGAAGQKTPEQLMRKHVSEQVADPLARRDVSINLLSARKYFLQRTMAQQVTGNFTQRLTGIKNITVRIHPRKHGRVALEATEAKQRLDRSRRAVD